MTITRNVTIRFVSVITFTMIYRDHNNWRSKILLKTITWQEILQSQKFPFILSTYYIWDLISTYEIWWFTLKLNMSDWVIICIFLNTIQSKKLHTVFNDKLFLFTWSIESTVSILYQFNGTVFLIINISDWIVLWFIGWVILLRLIILLCLLGIGLWWRVVRLLGILGVVSLLGLIVLSLCSRSSRRCFFSCILV